MSANESAVAVSRLRALRYPATCERCSIALPRGAKAYWRPGSVVCQACFEGAELALRAAGTAGASARAEGKRRSPSEELPVGLLARIAQAVKGGAAPSSWEKGATGEEQLCAFLERELVGEAIVLNDRRIPGSRANIDHIIVAPSAIWVVDAKRYAGKVERRDVGGLFRTELRLVVAGRDRTKLVAGMANQVAAVRAAIAPASAFAALPVRSAVCFTSSDWGLLGKPFELSGVLVTYPGALRDAVRAPELLDRSTIERVAARLATALPAYRIPVQSAS